MAADPKISKENFSPPVEVALLTPPRPGIDRADAMPTVPPSVTVTATGPRWWVDLTPTLRAVVVAGLLIAVGYLIRALAPVLTPFIAGAILSYIAAPVVAWLAARRVPRSAGAVMIVLTIGALIAGLVLVVVPLVSNEISQIATKMPELLTRAQTEWLPWVNAQLGTSISLDLTQVKSLMQDNAGAVGDLSAQLAGSLKLGGQMLIGVVVNAMLLPVVMFYLLRDWPTLIDGIDRLVPHSARPMVRNLAREIDAVLSEFLRGQGMVMLALATYYCIALKLSGLQFWLPVGLVTGLLVFIPYIGFGMGIMLGMLAALTQFSTAGPIIAVAVIFGLGQILEGFALTPYLVGDRIGLHPLAVIFALMAFGQLFGFVGVLLALPASAALLVALRVMQRSLAHAEIAPPVPPAA